MAPLGLRHRAVIDQCHALATPGRDMAVESVLAGVQLRAREPPIERRPGVIENGAWLAIPGEVGRLGPPELFGLTKALLVRRTVVTHAGILTGAEAHGKVTVVLARTCSFVGAFYGRWTTSGRRESRRRTSGVRHGINGIN